MRRMKRISTLKTSKILWMRNFLKALTALLVSKYEPTGVEVDVNDDSIDRWCVKHYQYDPERWQVRHVFLKAFSNQKAQMKYFTNVKDELQVRRQLEEVPSHEHITGILAFIRIFTENIWKRARWTRRIRPSSPGIYKTAPTFWRPICHRGFHQCLSLRIEPARTTNEYDR